MSLFAYVVPILALIGIIMMLIGFVMEERGWKF